MKKNKIIIIFLLIVSLSFITVNVYADDYSDDIYDGDYSIEDMLENYNVITFGKKDLDSHMTQNNFSKGDAKLFHINSQFLINGTLRLTRGTFFYYFLGKRLDEGRLDLNRSVDNLNSSFLYIDFPKAYSPSPASRIYSINGGEIELNYVIASEYNYPKVSLNNSLYMNFNRLYDSIIAEQNKIKKGKNVTSEDGMVHVETGGEYYIDDINNINEIVFDNFEDNKDDLTIITINNTGSITFPKIYNSTSNGENSLIPTNDFLGMNRPGRDYERYYVTEKYYGNIIWNVPNATYIELPSAPFIGHLVAPKADVYGPELHYGGAFLVNSLYLEGNSEAHYYPLTSTNIPYRSNPEPVKAILKIKRNQGNIKFNNSINNENLEEGMVVSFRVEVENDYLFSGIEIKDEEGNIIEFKKVGDNEYEFTMPATNVTITPQFKEKNIKNTIEQIITNPKTGNNIMLVLGIVIVGFVFGFRIIKKEKNKIM